MIRSQYLIACLALLAVATVRGSAQDQPVSLPVLLELAERNHPDLVVARARVEEARGRLVQAGLYPNPVITPGSEELGDRQGPGGIAGVTIAQEIVTAGKLRLAQAAAAAGVARADWEATTRWFEIVTRVRQAYYEALVARSEVQTSTEAVRIAEEGLEAVRKLEKAGVRALPDVLRAQVELDQNRVRLGQAQQRELAAGKLLATAAGVSALPVGRLEGSLDTFVPEFSYQTILDTVLSRSSEVQAAQAAVNQAEQLVQHARAERVPNVHVAVRPGYSDVDRTALVHVEVGAAFPLFNRNQGNIQAAEAELTRAVAEVRSVELRLTERLAGAFQRYAAARQQVDLYTRQILPNAREALRLVRLGYERGDPKYDYTAVLEAQRTLVQVRLLEVQARGELWRAVSEIEGLLQQDGRPSH
jgi:cobalt-zinc-cadmium efflux system outer membrane protein